MSDFPPQTYDLRVFLKVARKTFDLNTFSKGSGYLPNGCVH